MIQILKKLSIFLLGCSVVTCNTVTAKGSYFVWNKINNNSTYIQSLYSWFQNPTNHLDIIHVNPIYHRVEFISDKVVRIELLPVVCPGLKIYQMLDYDIYHNSTTLVLTSRPTTLKSIYQGSKLIAHLFFKSSRSSTLHSKSIISLRQLNNLPYLDKEEKVEMNMSFRNLYIPGLLNRVAVSASNAIQKSLMLNMNFHLDNILQLYSVEETKQLSQAERSKNIPSFYVLSKMLSNHGRKWRYDKNHNPFKSFLN